MQETDAQFRQLVNYHRFAKGAAPVAPQDYFTVWVKFSEDFNVLWQELEKADAKRQFKMAMLATEELRSRTRTRAVVDGKTSSLKKRFGFKPTPAPPPPTS